MTQKTKNGSVLADSLRRISQRPGLLRQLVHVGHLCVLGIQRAQLTRMAAALTYRTIFGLIPIIVVGLVVVAAFATKERVTDTVVSFLKFAGLDRIVIGGADGAPAGPPLPGASGTLDAAATHLDVWIAGLVQRIHGLPVGTIGVFGGLMLIYAAISMLVEIELAFNQIYNAPTGRAWTRRVMQYWAVLTLGTALLFASFSVTQGVMSWVSRLEESKLVTYIDGVVSGERSVQSPDAQTAAPDAPPAKTVTEATVPVEKKHSPLVRTLVTAVGFVLSVSISTILLFGIYATVPNTRVHIGPAFVGAITGATLWEAGKWGFTTYLKFSTGYSQLYGTLALLPLFLLWLYVTWLIVLLGLQIAHSMQTYRTATAQGFTESVLVTLGLMADESEVKPLRMFDPAGLVLVMSVAAEQFAAGKTTDHSDVSERTGLDQRAVVQMLDKLAGAGLLHRVAAESDDRYVLARPPNTIALAEVLQLAAEPREEIKSSAAQRLMDVLAKARLEAVNGKTLADAV